MKKGRIDASLFMKPTYNGIGNPFKEAARSLVRKENRQYQIDVGNEKAFRPIKHVRQPSNAAYPHMKDFEFLQKNFRDPENNNEVMIPPKNIMTNPVKRGRVGKWTSFSGQFPYMEDDFNRPKIMAKTERDNGKLLE